MTILKHARAALLFAFAMSTATAGAAPAPETNSACIVQNADAKMVTAYPADWPAFSQEQAASGVALIRVDLDENGTARDATVMHSTGYVSLDAAAKAAALMQKYSPEIQNCATVAGTYAVEVDFIR